MQVDNLHALPRRDFLDDGVYLVHDRCVHDSPAAVVGIRLQRGVDLRACRQVHEGVEEGLVIFVELFFFVLPVIVVVGGLPVLDAVVREELAVVCPELDDDNFGVEFECGFELRRVPVAHVVVRALVRKRHARYAEVLHAVAFAQHVLQVVGVLFLVPDSVSLGNAVADARHARLRACGARESRDCRERDHHGPIILSKHHVHNIILRRRECHGKRCGPQIAGVPCTTRAPRFAEPFVNI